MKIAVVLYGHLRSYQVCSADLIHNLIDPLNADLYMHTWSTTDYSSVLWDGSKSAIIKTDKNEIINRFKPIQFLVEEQREYSRDSKINGLYQRLYSISRALCLIDLSNYDYVILTRPDIRIKNKLSINEKESNKFFHIYPLAYKYSIRKGKYIIGGADLFNVISSDYANKLRDAYLSVGKQSVNKSIIDDEYINVLNSLGIKISYKIADYSIVRVDGSMIQNKMHNGINNKYYKIWYNNALCISHNLIRNIYRKM